MKLTYILSSALLAIAAVESAHAQIFAVDYYGAVGEYNSNGTVISSNVLGSDVLNGTGSISGLAVQADGAGYDLFVSGQTTGGYGYIAEYTASSDTATPTQVSSLSFTGDPTSLALSGSTLYAADYNTGTILSFNTTGSLSETGTLVSGLGADAPKAVATSGSNVYYASPGTSSNGTVGVVTGGTNYTLASGLDATALAVSGNDLYVANGGTIEEYLLNGTTATPTAFSVTDSHAPQALAVSGSDLLVTNDSSSDKLVAYNDVTGLVDATFNSPSFTSTPGEIAVLTAPEPSVFSLSALTFVGVCVVRLRRLMAI